MALKQCLSGCLGCPDHTEKINNLGHWCTKADPQRRIFPQNIKEGFAPRWCPRQRKYQEE